MLIEWKENIDRMWECELEMYVWIRYDKLVKFNMLFK